MSHVIGSISQLLYYLLNPKIFLHVSFISHYFATADKISWDLLTFSHHPWPFYAYNITYTGDEKGVAACVTWRT